MSSYYENCRSYRPELDRRRFIRLALVSGLTLLSPSQVFAAISNSTSKKRSLSLYNPNTREAVNTTYWSDGKYVQKALDEINYIMRDRRNGEIRQMDTDLLDLLYAMDKKLKVDKPFHIISGYRSPTTNTLLRKRGKGAARNSLHMEGKAVDIRLPGFRLSSLRRAATKLRAGGVGYYPRMRFVHIDVGSVRYWSGLKTRKSRS